MAGRIKTGVKISRLNGALLTTVVFLVLLAGCDRASLMKRVVAPQDEALARKYVELLRHNNFDPIEKDADPSIEGPDLTGTLEKMAALFPGEEPSSIKVVGANTVRGPDHSTSSITLEYEFRQKWLLAAVTTDTRDGARTIAGFRVSPVADSLENLNRFRFRGKGEAQYTILFLAVISSIISASALVLVVKSRTAKRKWLWAILTLVCVGQLSVDWTTGQRDMKPLTVQVGPVAAFAPPYGAWVVHVSFPLGAIIFLVRRERLWTGVPSQ